VAALEKVIRVTRECGKCNRKRDGLHPDRFRRRAMAGWSGMMIRRSAPARRGGVSAGRGGQAAQ